MLAARRLASCYRPRMKPIDQIRRENLQALVAKEPSQAAFARKIGKDKNQVSQWLGRAGARNISGDTAREIEAACGIASGWLDHDHIQHLETTPVTDSQPGRLDEEKLAASITWLQTLFNTWRRDFDPVKHSRLIAAVYAELLTPTEPNLVRLSQSIAKQLDEETAEDDRQGKARRA